MIFFTNFFVKKITHLDVPRTDKDPTDRPLSVSSASLCACSLVRSLVRSLVCSLV